jgi:uncharacterized membrane-anchored protein YitT (DUF2179 family)
MTEKKIRKLDSRKLGRVLTNLALLSAGSVVFAASVDLILVPNNFLAGGLLGLSLIVHYLSPELSVGLLYALLNLPFIVLGWFKIGHRFIYYTTFGIAVFALASELIVLPPLEINNLLLATILAGVISGAGGGLVFRSAGSLGGADILAVFLNKRLSFRMGWTYLLVNILVLGASALIFDLERALMAMLYTYVTGKVIDAVLTGFNRRESLLIVSDKSEEIAQGIISKMRRGVTYLQGEGAYTGNPKKVVMSIVALTELSKMKDLIFDIDPEAFVVINQTLEVMGKRHGSRRVY